LEPPPVTLRLALPAAIACAALCCAPVARAEGDAPESKPAVHHSVSKAMAKARAKVKAAASAAAANSASTAKPAPTGAPALQPPPPPGGTPVAFDDLPPQARAALLTYYRTLAEQGPGCGQLSFGAFLMGIGPILKTEYNRDGEPDFLFTAPCAGPIWNEVPLVEDALGPPQKILLSDPFGYHVSAQFSAVFGKIQGRTALLSVIDCPDALSPRATPGRCYVGRFWDGAKGQWGEAQPLRTTTPSIGAAP
jgi:hypothetical protein